VNTLFSVKIPMTVNVEIIERPFPPAIGCGESPFLVANSGSADS
jgi:hypothetical protein